MCHPRSSRVRRMRWRTRTRGCRRMLSLRSLRKWLNEFMTKSSKIVCNYLSNVGSSFLRRKNISLETSLLTTHHSTDFKILLDPSCYLSLTNPDTNTISSGVSLSLQSENKYFQYSKVEEMRQTKESYIDILTTH